MGLKSTFEEQKNKNSQQLESVLKESKTYLWAQSLNLSSKETLVLSSLSLLFIKMVAIDREILDSEIKEVKKRLLRFIKIEEPAFSALLNASKNDISKRENAALIGAAASFLSQKANDKTRERIFRYLINIISADKKVEKEESYLLELIGDTFGVSEKTVREYLLAAELQTSLEELEKSDPNKDPYSNGDSVSPIITFEIL